MKDSISVSLILFSCLGIGIGIALFQIYSSDFKEFHSPFTYPFMTALSIPLISLIIPTIFLTVIFALLNLVNNKAATFYLIFLVSVSLILYIFRTYFLIANSYLVSPILIGLIIIVVTLIVIMFHNFILSFLKVLSIIILFACCNFCYKYYNFLSQRDAYNVDLNKNQSNIFEIGNTQTPVFVFIFDELSSYLLLDGNGKIDEQLFPELKDFSEISTWYPNATTQISDTLTSRSQIFSGFDYFKQCKDSSGLCENNIVYKLIDGKKPVKTILQLNGISSKVNNMDKWYSLDDPSHSLLNNNSLGRYKQYVRNLIKIYLQALVHPNWSSKLIDTDNTFMPDQFKLAKGAIVPGKPDSFGFYKCLEESELTVDRFNLFIDRFDVDQYLINSILTDLTHTPFCFDTEGPVELVYPIRKFSDNNRSYKYLPDAVAMDDFVLSTCGYDETAYIIRRARINQTKLAFKLFNKALQKIKEMGIYEKSLIIAMSDHGVGFLGPSFGRGNYMQRNKENILDNRMMNASILLMMKYPDQVNPKIDNRLVRPVDVGATLIDALNITPPWNVDGQSLLAKNWNDIKSPINSIQLLYKNNEWNNNSKVFIGGEVIKPMDYFSEIYSKSKFLKTYKSDWIGKDTNEIPLANQNSGKLEYLKIEKKLLADIDTEYVLVLGGQSYDPDLNPSPITHIAMNNTVIKSIKPCLSFRHGQHKLGEVMAGWVVDIPREFLKSKRISIRAFSPVDDTNNELYYELENPINIELTDDQFLKVGNIH